MDDSDILGIATVPVNLLVAITLESEELKTKDDVVVGIVLTEDDARSVNGTKLFE